MSSAGLARKCKDEIWLLKDEERKKAIVDGLRTSSGDLRVVNEGQ